MAKPDMTRPDRPARRAAGLPGERTYLAWQRTGLAFAAVGALLVHAASRLHSPLAYLPGVFGLVMSGAVLLRALVKYRSITAAGPIRRGVASPWTAAGLAAAATVLGVTGLIIVLST
jgi:uncharacterized membrane protein YidH (DUF202 family)